MVSNSDYLFLDDIQLREELNDFVISEDIIYQLCASLSSGKNIILEGVPGTGKTRLAISLAKVAEENKFSEGYILTTATSDWSTFDTIGGLIPNESGKLIFHPGKFLEAIASNKWIIVDEINRADIDKAFGQLFTILSGQDVELPYKYDGKSIKIKIWDEKFSKFDDETATYYIGSNWRIIGTMNIDDKDNLFDLSYAFMRRFMFIEIECPGINGYSKLIKNWCDELDDYYFSKFIDLLEMLSYKKIGPAIFKDMIEYIKFKEEIANNEMELTFSESISSYLLPQLEGLDKKNSVYINDLLKKLEVISAIEMDFYNII